MMEEPSLAAQVGERFDHILVDEYQDTNKLQADILRRLKPDGQGVTVVGDDAQSIYSFRAASVRNILDFPTQYSPPATIVTLAQNYRSSQAILDASNAVIGLSKERFTKDLFATARGGSRPLLVTVADENAQVSYVADRVLAEREAGIPSSAKPCSSAPPTIATPWRSSSAGATYPSSSSAGYASWKPPTSKMFSLFCVGRKTRTTRWPPSAPCSSSPALGRP